MTADDQLASPLGNFFFSLSRCGGLSVIRVSQYTLPSQFPWTTMQSQRVLPVREFLPAPLPPELLFLTAHSTRPCLRSHLADVASDECDRLGLCLLACLQ